MRIRGKILIVCVGALLIAAFAPLVWSARGTTGYFYDGRCACGHNCYVRIQGHAYLKYSPGHQVPEHRAFTLRPTADGWDLLGLPHSDTYWSPLEGEAKSSRTYDSVAETCTKHGGTALNQTRLTKVYNPWPIWAAKLLKQ